MADSPWLFPESAEPLVERHRRYFASMSPPGRPLSCTELERFDAGMFPAGWTFELKTQAGSTPAFFLLNWKAPFAEPKIALAKDRYYLKWPHVEANGVLCLRNGESIDHSSSLVLTRHYITEAESLFKATITGRNCMDFITEFQSYWMGWCVQRSGGRQQVLLLADPGPPTRNLYFNVLSAGQIVACDNLDKGLKWIRERFSGKKVSEDTFSKGMFLWLESGLKPEDYPKTNAGLAGIMRNSGDDNLNHLMAAVPEKPGNLFVVFGFESGNGPALGALCLNEPEKVGWTGKKAYPRFKGFRQNRCTEAMARRRFFSVSGKATPMLVQRIDRKWIFERGSKEYAPELDHIRIGIIGCGSLGAQITMLLAQSGIRRFLLIDPELLSVDNIARHLLGSQFVGQPKADALEKHLKSHFPGMMDIVSKISDWESVFSDPKDREILLSCDLLISTVGSWDVESALNHGFNGLTDFPPVVYGWTEPYGFAGHALLTTGTGGCLACGMNHHGKFCYKITNWPNVDIQRRAPACGVTYQPYGVLNIAQTQAMIARLCMEYVMGGIQRCQHWAWFGDIEKLKKAGGELSKGIVDYYGKVQSYRMVKQDWEFMAGCRYNHQSGNKH